MEYEYHLEDWYDHGPGSESFKRSLNKFEGEGPMTKKKKGTVHDEDNFTVLCPDTMSMVCPLTSLTEATETAIAQKDGSDLQYVVAQVILEAETRVHIKPYEEDK